MNQDKTFTHINFIAKSYNFKRNACHGLKLCLHGKVNKTFEPTW